MTKVIYNNLSKKFKEAVGWDEPLRADGVVEFEWLHIQKTKQNGVELPSYGLKRIPNVDSVFDEWAEGGPRMVQIAFIEAETGNEKEPYRFGEIHFKKTDRCTITITGREPKKFGLLNYLRACNFNSSNPLANPSSSLGFLFKEMEPVKTAKQKIKEDQAINSVKNYIYDMNEAKTISMLQALQQPIHSSFEENQLALIEFVNTKQGRDKFNRLSTDVRMPIAALIGKATELDKIRYEDTQKMWVYVPTKRMIIQVPPQTDGTAHLIEYFHNNEHGKAFKEFLESEIAFKNTEEALEDAKDNLAMVEEGEKKNKGGRPKKVTE